MRKGGCAQGGRGGADLREGPEEGGGGDGVGGGHWETEELRASREDKMEGDEAEDWEAEWPGAAGFRDEVAVLYAGVGARLWEMGFGG